MPLKQYSNIRLAYKITSIFGRSSLFLESGFIHRACLFKAHGLLIIISIMSIQCLVGCQSVPIENASEIVTTTKLQSPVSLPIPISVAFHIDEYEPEVNLVNFYGPLRKASKLVLDDMFYPSVEFKDQRHFHFLVKLKTSSEFKSGWGNWATTLNTSVLDREGNTLFSSSETKSSTALPQQEWNGIFNAQAHMLKEMLVRFLNQEGSEKIENSIEKDKSISYQEIDFKKFINVDSPSSTGTGFFINNSGTFLTAAHVINDCAYIEVLHNGEKKKATLIDSSLLLDVSALNSNHLNTAHVTWEQQHGAPILGEQVFVTGFPLSSILSNYPSLTIGNISSLGGLKGADYDFQYSAPVQPGNSGGPIVDYKGRLKGMVSSSLNQKMMLENTSVVSQNVNFGISTPLLEKYLNRHDMTLLQQNTHHNFETASKEAVKYTNQVLCYK